MELRKCTSSDVKILACFNKCLIEDEQSDNPMNEESLACRMKDFLENNYEAYFFINSEEIVGYALLKVDVSPVYLRQFYIDRPYRRQHFGKEAFNLLVEELKLSCVDLDVLSCNKTGMKFWESLCFTERSKGLRFGKPCTK